MKKLLTISLAITLSLPTLSQTFSLSWIDQDAKTKKHSFHNPSPPSNWRGQGGGAFDLTYLRLLFTLNPEKRYITGSIMNYYRILSEPPHTLVFDMHDSLNVNIIRYHGEELTTFTHENNLLKINLPNALAFGTIDSIMIDYQGVPVEDGLGSFSVEEHEGVPILATLSEPYGARTWWPCKQDLNDKIDSILVVSTTPAAYRTASNGVLVAEDTCHGNRVMQWKHNHPIAAYLIAVAVTNYEQYRDWVPLENGDSIEILNYVYPEFLEQAQKQTPGLIEVFHLYNNWFGLYPYADEKYGHAQWEWAGGMEHQTMSFMGSFGHDLMAHELAHQWFGDYVTCASWADIWLNEGFATYLTGLTYEHMFNGTYWDQFKRLSIDRILREPDGSVFCTDTSDVNRIFDARLSYSKGGMVLHALRGQIGDSAFFAGMKNYYNAFANDYATTTDFRQQMEAVADTSLTEFFNDWIYGEGYPTYQYEYEQDKTGALKITLYQTQSHPSVDFFEMKVPIKMRGMNADTTVWVNNTQTPQTFTLLPHMPVSEVQIDPERWIITKNPILVGVENRKSKIENSLSFYPNPAKETIVITLKEPLRSSELKLINTQGQTVVKRQIEPSIGSFEINIENLPPGIYFLSWEKEIHKLIHY